MGLLNFLPEDKAKKQAARQGLLSLGAAMLQGKGNFGNMLGQGIQAGAQGYQGSLQEQQAAQMRQIQGDRWKLENDQTRAAIAEPGELARIVGGGQMPAAQTAAPQSGVMPLSALPTAGGQPSPQPAAVTPNSAEYYRAIGDRLSASGRVKAAEPYYNMAEKMKPKLKEQRALTKDGKRVMANVYDDGRTEMVEGFAPDAEKLSFQNTGGATVALDPFTGQPVQTIRNSQSPDSVASNAVAVRGQNLTDARGREANRISASEVQMGGKPPPGYRWNGANLEAIPGGPGDKLPESQQKQVVGVNNLSNAIREYRTDLKTFGALDALRPDTRATMGTKYNNMMLQAKEAYNLGVLNGPDLEILTSVITDPRSLKGAVTSKAALDKQASELDRIMGGVGQVSGQARQPQNRPAPAAPQVGTVKGGYMFKGGNPADKSNWVKQ